MINFSSLHRAIALTLLTALTVTAHGVEPQGEVQWSYTGEGAPEHWGSLEPAFEVCRTGQQQSPINVVPSSEADLPNLAFNYSASGAKIWNNGHTIQITPDARNSVTHGDKQLTLLQMHLHTPAEHLADGKHYAAEAHFVHHDEAGALTVVGVYIEEGEPNPVLQYMIDHAPTEIDATNTVAAPINLADLLPHNREYTTYAGSLTTPPCSEGVTWVVYARPVSASSDQIAALNTLMGQNNRPVQAINDRALTLDATP